MSVITTIINIILTAHQYGRSVNITTSKNLFLTLQTIEFGGPELEPYVCEKTTIITTKEIAQFAKYLVEKVNEWTNAGLDLDFYSEENHSGIFFPNAEDEYAFFFAQLEITGTTTSKIN